MDKIYEALKKILPADQVREVAKAVEELVAEARYQLEDEYNNKLNEAYEQIANEMSSTEATAVEGYQQAYRIISDLQLRLEHQQEEFENALEEGYEEAYQMLQQEQAKNANIEVEVYDEFENKLKQVRKFMVDQVDKFLHLQNAEIYEQARRDILNDPRMVEHRVALDRIVEVASQYISEEDFAGATSSKLADVTKKVEDLTGHLRVLEARNVRLSTQNTKLNEQVREFNNLLNENTRAERTERAKKPRNVSGRGNRALGRGEQILTEFNHNRSQSQEELDQTFVEHEALNDMLVLSGLKHDS